MFRKALFITLVVALAAGCPKKEDDPPPPPPTFGPSVVAGGNDALLYHSGDMMAWTQILQTESTIQTDADITKIVKVPGHASNRLVAIVNNPTVNENDLIYYNDAGGTGAWTKAKFSAAATDDFTYLDLEHRPTGAYDEWTLYDVFFIDATTGYAVGNNYIVLWTYDAGATWHDMNAYQGLTPATIEFQEIDLGSTVPAAFVVGATVQNADNSHNGRIIAIDEYWSVITVDVTNTTAFVSSPTADTIQVGSTGTPVAITIDNTDIWMVPMTTIYSVFATALTTGEHTVNFGLYYNSSSCGHWKAVSNAPTSPELRTFVFWGPPVTEQTDAGELGDYSVNGLFFFDATTGVAGTDNGVFYTLTGGADWIQFTGTALDSYHQFAYSLDNLASDGGFLYSLNADDDNPGRTQVTYTAGVWSFGTTPAWVDHGTPTNVGIDEVEQADSIFLSGGKLFVSNGYWSGGHWAYCANPNADATGFNDTLWNETDDTYEAGTTNDNPVYQKNVLFGTTGYVNSICKR